MGRRSPLHPEEARKRVLARSIERSERQGPPTGWHWPHGWMVKLFAPDGSVHRRFTATRATYAEACELRDEEMAGGGYDKAWLERLETDVRP